MRGVFGGLTLTLLAAFVPIVAVPTPDGPGKATDRPFRIVSNTRSRAEVGGRSAANKVRQHENRSS